MKISVSEIEEGFDIDLSEKLQENSHLETVGPVNAHLSIERHGGDVEIKGEIQGTVKLKCSRCLVDFRRDISFDIDLLYQPIEVIQKEEVHEISDGEIAVGFYGNDEIDLTHVIGEQLLLNFPMKPLCNENCRGICSTCGTDLNSKQCECQKDSIDPRFEALKKLSSSRKEN
jgi:uncharacterized protein